MICSFYVGKKKKMDSVLRKFSPYYFSAQGVAASAVVPSLNNLRFKLLSLSLAVLATVL